MASLIAVEKSSLVFDPGWELKKTPQQAIEDTAAELEPVFNRIKDAAKARLRSNGNVLTGALSASIALKKGVKIRRNRLWFGVGVNSKFKIRTKSGKLIWPVKYAHFVDSGFTHISGVRVEAKPFMAQAVNDAGGQDKIDAMVLRATNAVFEKQLGLR